MSDRIKLAAAMGWTKDKTLTDPQVWAKPGKTEADGWYFDYQLPDPFTDANDEREVFKHICAQTFSVRSRFFRELDTIVQNRVFELADLVGGGTRVAWPEAMMFMQDGDIARAALKVVNPNG